MVFAQLCGNERTGSLASVSTEMCQSTGCGATKCREIRRTLGTEDTIPRGEENGHRRKGQVSWIRLCQITFVSTRVRSNPGIGFVSFVDGDRQSQGIPKIAPRSSGLE